MSWPDTPMRTATDILRKVSTRWAPPEQITCSEWADRYRILSEASAEPGRWRTARAPYLREILDSFSDPAVREVWWMKSAQVGATEALNNAVGYYIHKDPGSILFLHPTVEMGQSFSKDRLQPMFRDCPALAELVAENKSRDSGNTITHTRRSPADLWISPAPIVLRVWLVGQSGLCCATRSTDILPQLAPRAIR